MQGTNLFILFLERFNQSRMPYMVTGSVASIIYGEPRMTHDIDLVLQIHADDVSDLIDLFPGDLFYCPPHEAIQTEIARKTSGHFNIIHHETGFKADIYPAGDDELHQWALAERKRIELGQMTVWIAPPEYVIIRKLQYYKEGRSTKHLRDINRMLAFSAAQMDMALLAQMVEKRGLADEWQAAKNAL